MTDIDNIKNTGKRVQYFRKQKGMTQKDFAKKFGVSTVTMSMIETGKRILRSYELVEISQILGVDYSQLRYEEKKQPPKKATSEPKVAPYPVEQDLAKAIQELKSVRIEPAPKTTQGYKVTLHPKWQNNKKGTFGGEAQVEFLDSGIIVSGVRYIKSNPERDPYVLIYHRTMDALTYKRAVYPQISFNDGRNLQDFCNAITEEIKRQYAEGVPEVLFQSQAEYRDFRTKMESIESKNKRK
jgi:transcriptional regulator with XRE-family HTH domain